LIHNIEPTKDEEFKMQNESVDKNDKEYKLSIYVGPVLALYLFLIFILVSYLVLDNFKDKWGIGMGECFLKFPSCLVYFGIGAVVDPKARVDFIVILSIVSLFVGAFSMLYKIYKKI
jgi:hypothetical protein